MTELVAECAREEERLMVSRLAVPISARGMESRRSAAPLAELDTERAPPPPPAALGMDRRRYAWWGLDTGPEGAASAGVVAPSRAWPSSLESGAVMPPYDTPSREFRLLAPAPAGAGPCAVVPWPAPLFPASSAAIPLYDAPSMECRRATAVLAEAEAEADADAAAAAAPCPRPSAPPAKGAVSPLYATPSMECRRGVLLPVAAAGE